MGRGPMKKFGGRFGHTLEKPRTDNCILNMKHMCKLVKLKNLLRGPYKRPRRAGFGPRAVLCPPLLKGERQEVGDAVKIFFNDFIVLEAGNHVSDKDVGLITFRIYVIDFKA